LVTTLNYLITLMGFSVVRYLFVARTQVGSALLLDAVKRKGGFAIMAIGDGW
jgi:hypothetical protein